MRRSLALAAGAAQAQSTTTTQVKSFEIISVDGNVVVVKEADGTHEYTLPADFRFTVGDKQVPVQELKPGMKGKATITTTTTVKPVHVTEVKNGQVMKNLGAGSVIVRTADSIKMFSQGEIDKRGIRIYKDGRAGPAVGPARGRQAHRDLRDGGSAQGPDREAGGGDDRRGGGGARRRLRRRPRLRGSAGSGAATGSAAGAPATTR